MPVERVVDQLQIAAITSLIPSIYCVGSKVGDLHESGGPRIKEEGGLDNTA